MLNTILEKTVSELRNKRSIDRLFHMRCISNILLRGAVAWNALKWNDYDDDFARFIAFHIK